MRRGMVGALVWLVVLACTVPIDVDSNSSSSSGGGGSSGAAGSSGEGGSSGSGGSSQAGSSNGGGSSSGDVSGSASSLAGGSSGRMGGSSGANSGGGSSSGRGGSSRGSSSGSLPGGVDPAFGNGGAVTFTVGILDVLARDDGTILVSTYDSYGTTGPADAGALVQLTANGAADTSFGSGGVVNLQAMGSAAVSIRAMASGPQGTRLAGGVAVMDNGAWRHHMMTANLTANGTLSDVVIPPLGAGLTGAAAMVSSVKAGGDWASVGWVQPNFDDFVAKGGAAGLDGAFGNGGMVLTPDGQTSNVNVDVGNGRVVVLRSTGNGTSEWTYTLVAYNNTGALDATFGTGGQVTLCTGPIAVWLPLSMDSQGRVLVGVTCNGAGGALEGRLMRVLGNGSADSTFGAGGTVVLNPGNGDVTVGAMDVDAQGRIYVAGLNVVPGTPISPASRRLFTTRLLSSGAVDGNTFVEDTFAEDPPTIVRADPQGNALLVARGVLRRLLF